MGANVNVNVRAFMHVCAFCVYPCKLCLPSALGGRARHSRRPSQAECQCKGTPTAPAERVHTHIRLRWYTAKTFAKKYRHRQSANAKAHQPRLRSECARAHTHTHTLSHTHTHTHSHTHIHQITLVYCKKQLQKNTVTGRVTMQRHTDLLQEFHHTFGHIRRTHTVVANAMQYPWSAVTHHTVTALHLAYHCCYPLSF